MPDLLAALRAVLPSGVVSAAPDDSPLWPVEQIGPAVPGRLAEFAAGRSAARAAMRALGHNPAAIPAGADRAPLWPAGLTGSITHCAGACLAVVGRTTQWAGLGLDAEPVANLEPALWPTLLAEGESVADGQAALALFVAKEAAYKAQYALSRQLFDFQTLRLIWQGDRFGAAFTRAVAPFASGTVLSGQMVRTSGHLAAFVAIAAQEQRIP
ncbi:4'-phosphopantetheinyl transferase family protein [Fuscibacter oryzae]|uniref:4'-phosphopantetheinyl transferase superfamily protein n=1 Tax=Fuscibacter oryzae TaxID=2803939 RepID=A0A8J7MRF7_9RHOB|nr:4'-phosphopantetheinyl transferase superfamily protein [Fuscibacter oryzae]MBL4928222.1 4'-phosphopantetheinyl transferase superfamily protein [Fuscibacter oryzae]